ncbi:MAG: thioesterase [Gammaproteobacteria bacterium]|nr:thioesterase [Gammaproteobacteria bacterium]
MHAPDSEAQVLAAGQVLTPVRILAEWTSAAGQLLPGFYTAAFDGAIDDLKDAIGLNAAWRAQHRRSTVALEARLRFLGLAWRAEQLLIESRIVDFDAKRLRIAQSLQRGAEVLATRESLAISFDLEARRACAFDTTLARQIAMVHAAQQRLAAWPWVGQAYLTVAGVTAPADP